MIRCSCPGVFCRKGALRNFAKFTRQYLCQSLFFNKVAGLRHMCFPVNFAKFLGSPFLQNTSGGCSHAISVLFSMTESYMITRRSLLLLIAVAYLNGNYYVIRCWWAWRWRKASSHVISTIMVIISEGFLMFYQFFFFSSQVKQSVIISSKHGIDELPHELLNDVRLKIFGN